VPRCWCCHGHSCSGKFTENVVPKVVPCCERACDIWIFGHCCTAVQEGALRWFSHAVVGLLCRAWHPCYCRIQAFFCVVMRWSVRIMGLQRQAERICSLACANIWSACSGIWCDIKHQRFHKNIYDVTLQCNDQHHVAEHNFCIEVCEREDTSRWISECQPFDLCCRPHFERF
jgi:hypothetical protein